MCYEDIKLGLRRWARVTNVGVGATVVFPANKMRVVFRVVPNAQLLGQTQTHLGDTTAVSDRVVLNSSGAQQQLTLERDGTLVQETLTVIGGTGSTSSVTEVFDSELDHAPPPGNPYDSVSRAK